MEKFSVDHARSRSGQATLPGFPAAADEEQGGGARRHALTDRERAQQACAPMGALESIVVSHDTGGERRVWYVVDPDPLMANHYAAHGLELTHGCKAVVDAEALRPVAVIEVDPASAGTMADASTPYGFNPYWDLPPT
jgi:hypothetical protein